MVYDLREGVTFLLSRMSATDLLVALFFGSVTLLLSQILFKLFWKSQSNSTVNQVSSEVGTTSMPSTDEQFSPKDDGETSIPLSFSTTFRTSPSCLDIAIKIVSFLFNLFENRLHLSETVATKYLHTLWKNSKSKDTLAARIAGSKLLGEPTFTNVQKFPRAGTTIIFKADVSFQLRVDTEIFHQECPLDKEQPSLVITVQFNGNITFLCDIKNTDPEAKTNLHSNIDIEAVIDGSVFLLDNSNINDASMFHLEHEIIMPSSCFTLSIDDINSLPDLQQLLGSLDDFSVRTQNSSLLESQESKETLHESASTTPLNSVQNSPESPDDEAQAETEQGTLQAAVLPNENTLTDALEEKVSLERVGETLIVHSRQNLPCLPPRKLAFLGGKWVEIDGLALSHDISNPVDELSLPPTLTPRSQSRQSVGDNDDNEVLNTILPVAESDLMSSTESKEDYGSALARFEGDSSSLSGISAVSGSSTRTYLGEASTLVIETTTNNIMEHYLIPHGLSDSTKLKKRGKKLHLFLEHAFVARHLPGGTKCEVCGKSLPRRPPPIKQGYECRYCHLRCHKMCHVRVDKPCPTSKAFEMDLKIAKLTPEGKLQL